MDIAAPLADEERSDHRLAAPSVPSRRLLVPSTTDHPAAHATPCCSRYAATTRCAERLPLACRVVSEIMPLAFRSAGAYAHRHRC
ncbi:hypothetical protein T492DRAFT_1090792, partial [Pavlovales sp. CCMP2436]